MNGSATLCIGTAVITRMSASVRAVSAPAQHERVHHGAEHADVVRFRPADAPPLGHPAAEVVTAADDDRDLDAEVVHGQHLIGDPSEARGIDAGCGGPG